MVCSCIHDHWASEFFVFILFSKIRIKMKWMMTFITCKMIIMLILMRTIWTRIETIRIQKSWSPLKSNTLLFSLPCALSGECFIHHILLYIRWTTDILRLQEIYQVHCIVSFYDSLICPIFVYGTKDNIIWTTGWGCRQWH